VFRGLRGEFRDLVTSLTNKADLLSYSEFHSHLSTHEFIHCSSLPSILPIAPLLPILAQPPSVYTAQCGFSRSNGMVSWLIRAEVEGVAGGILAETFLGPTISLFVVLVVVLLSRKLAVIMNSGSNTINDLQHQTSGHDNR